MDPSEEDNPVKKKFRIQRLRLGKIMFVDEEGKYGFIDAEDFKDDVFFHIQDWERYPRGKPNAVPVLPEVEMWIEFELNDEHFDTEKKLRAKVVRPTNRPTGRKLSGRDATFKIITHHTNARRKRPTWRK